MEEGLRNRLSAGLEFGSDVLVNPVDLCYIDKLGLFIVADDTNGVYSFNLKGEQLDNVRFLADAGGVCFNYVTNQLVVTVSRAMTPLDPTAGELHFVEINETCGTLKCLNKIDLPTEPLIKAGNIRWVTVNNGTGDIFIATGDSLTAIIWKLNGNKIWSTVFEQTGNLEHLLFCNIDPPEILVSSWTETKSWVLLRLRLDCECTRVEQCFDAIAIENTQNRMEPWASTVDALDRICVYDYPSGNILSFLPPNYKMCQLIGAVKAGQWVSFAADKKKSWVYCACSDERCIRGFKINIDSKG